MSESLEQMVKQAIDSNREARQEQQGKLARLTNALTGADDDEFRVTTSDILGLAAGGDETQSEAGPD